MKIKDAKEIIEYADICGQPPCLVGVHGIGKSEIIANYAKEKELHSEIQLLSMMDVGDMLGIPSMKDVEGITSTVWSPPVWYINIVNRAWPEQLERNSLNFHDPDFKKFFDNELTGNDELVRRELLNNAYCKYYNEPNDKLRILRQENVTYAKSKRSILFLDEFNRAPQDILNASLELILNHRMGCHELPIVDGKETFVVAAINPLEDGYSVQDFDPAMLDRFLMCPLEADLYSWVRWARDNGVNETIIEYLLDGKDKWFHHTPSDQTKGTSPRTWTKLSKYLNYMEANGKEPSSYYILGLLGPSATPEFLDYYNNANGRMTLKKLEELLENTISDNDRRGNTNPEKIAEDIAEQVAGLDVIQRQDYAQSLASKFNDVKASKELLPMLVYLYAMPLETFVPLVLDLYGDDNTEAKINLSNADYELTGSKKLFSRTLSKIDFEALETIPE